MTDKSDDKVGHLNAILARGARNLNDPIFKLKVQMPGLARAGGGGDLEVSILSAHSFDTSPLNSLLSKFRSLLKIEQTDMKMKKD